MTPSCKHLVSDILARLLLAYLGVSPGALSKVEVFGGSPDLSPPIRPALGRRGSFGMVSFARMIFTALVEGTYSRKIPLTVRFGLVIC